MASHRRATFPYVKSTKRRFDSVRSSDTDMIVSGNLTLSARALSSRSGALRLRCCPAQGLVDGAERQAVEDGEPVVPLHGKPLSAGDGVTDDDDMGWCAVLTGIPARIDCQKTEVRAGRFEIGGIPDPLNADPNAVQAEARAVLVAGQHEVDEAGAVTERDGREHAGI